MTNPTLRNETKHISQQFQYSKSIEVNIKKRKDESGMKKTKNWKF